MNALTDDELASRLTRLVPALDGSTRSELLQVFYPVSSAAFEEATPLVLELAIARLRDDGVLKARTADFFAERPQLVERLWRGPARAVAPLGFVEGLAWITAILFVIVAGVRTFAAPPDAVARKASHAPLAALATPLAPPLEPYLKERKAKRLVAVRQSLATQAPAAAVSADPVDTTGAATTEADEPQARATPFRNVDFSGYFKKIRENAWRFAHGAEAGTQPTPTPTQTPAAKPKVRPLFDWIFGGT